MSGLGPEWREVSYVEYRDDGVPAARTATVRVGDEDPHYFIRDEPLLALPTEPYTVIRVAWDPKQTGYAGHVLVRLPEGSYHDWSFGGDEGDGFGSTEQLRREIVNFEVLAEPRAVTAKAVLERVREYLGMADDDGFRDIAREFGVTA